MPRKRHRKPANASGKRLVALRQAREWSQAELGRRLGITQAAVSLLESGKNRPSEPVLLLIAMLETSAAG